MMSFIFPVLLAAALLGSCTAPDPQRGAQLLAAAEAGDVAAVERLLAEQVGTEVHDPCHWTPLMKAAAQGHIAVAQRLLAAGADVAAADRGDYTSLLLAAGNGHTAMVELLLAHGAAIDHQETTQGFTALIWAAQRGHTATVAALLQHGANTQITDFAGLTAAAHARAAGHAEILKMLTGAARGAPQASSNPSNRG